MDEQRDTRPCTMEPFHHVRRAKISRCRNWGGGWTTFDSRWESPRGQLERISYDIGRDETQECISGDLGAHECLEALSIYLRNFLRLKTVTATYDRILNRLEDRRTRGRRLCIKKGVCTLEIEKLPCDTRDRAMKGFDKRLDIWRVASGKYFSEEQRT